MRGLYQSNRADNPRDLHDREKANFDRRLDLIKGLGTGWMQSVIQQREDVPMTAIDAR